MNISDDEEFYDAFESEEALKMNQLSKYINDTTNYHYNMKLKNERTQQSQKDHHDNENQSSSISKSPLMNSTQNTNCPNIPMICNINSDLNGITIKYNEQKIDCEVKNSHNKLILIHESTKKSIENPLFKDQIDIQNTIYFQTTPVQSKNNFGEEILSDRKIGSDEKNTRCSSNCTDSDDSKGHINLKYLSEEKKQISNGILQMPNNAASSSSINNEISEIQKESELIKNQSNSSPIPKKMILYDMGQFPQENLKIHEKRKSDFEKLVCLQNIPSSNIRNPNLKNKKSTSTSEACWVAKFSPNEKYLAIGCGDGILRLFKVLINDDYYDSNKNLKKDNHAFSDLLDTDHQSFIRHTLDIIDISWHKNSINILTASMDHKVILWNILEPKKIREFIHGDIVSCVSFHSLVDDFFATGCFDKMIRIWDITENKVIDWLQTNDIITAMAFSPDKQHVVFGFFKGICKIYRIDQGKLKFVGEVYCKNKYSFGKLNKTGKKVTSIVFTDDLEFLVTTNDSRMRLIDFKRLNIIMKYKGYTNKNQLLSVSYNYEKQLAIIGSEDGKVHIYNRMADYVPQINVLNSLRKKNRNVSYEYFIPFQKLMAPCAVWVPFNLTKRYRENMINHINRIYIDCMMIIISHETDIKIFGSIIQIGN